MAWSLFDEKGNLLEAKKFSNGKNQEDIVKEVVNEIRGGRKVIFIHGVCGSGKSVIALNIAKELGRASIVVPIKNLQRQYAGDYMNKKFLLKGNGEKLKISMITGRRNHECLYLKENKKEIEEKKNPEIIEKNANLYDIFLNKNMNNNDENNSKVKENISCDNLFIPCKIEIREKNLKLIKKYYFENPERKNNRDLNLKRMRRFAVAPACSYWCPIMNADKDVNLNAKEIKYKSLAGEHIIYQRKEGCPYYKQFLSYSNSEVIIFNSEQYLLETALGRKPATDVEIIDECDEFLDSFAVEGMINFDRLLKELRALSSTNKDWEEKEKEVLEEIIKEINLIYEDSKKNHNLNEIEEINKTKIAELIKIIAKNDVFHDNRDEESYMEHCLEVAEDFYDIIDEAYVSFARDRKNNFYAKLVTINLDRMLNSIIDKNKAFVFMSGTLHSERVLKEIFGLKDFKVIDAETFNLGTITKVKTGLEKDFKFENFNNGQVTREDYLAALNKCVEVSEKPTVVQVNAFNDLPNEDEIIRLNLKNLISSEKLMEEQDKDKEGKIVKEFKEGKTKILFTTRCTRGIDFPFETCNSVVITKFPYPHAKSLFWQLLKKQKPSFFWDFYKDKARRELLQRIYRSVRASDDHVFLLSPDIRVLESKIV